MTNNYRLIVTLSALSGICGLSYQILYSRILSTYFGSISYVAAAIIGGFLLGIAIGPLIARRLTPYIAHVEALVGIVGAAAAVFFMSMGSAPLAWVGGIAGSPLLIALSAGVIISIPALLIGLSLPLFAIYLRYARIDSEDSDGFRVSYLFYNLGAGVCVLLVELLIRSYVWTSIAQRAIEARKLL
jgi:spermidine synthase